MAIDQGVPREQLVAQYELEIQNITRDELDKVIFCLDDFNLPDAISQQISQVQGPGQAPRHYPGPPTFGEMTLNLTDFYELNIVQFLLDWLDEAKASSPDYRKAGEIIGYDDEGTIVTKVKVEEIWPTLVSQGRVERTTQKQKISVTLSLREFAHVLI